MSVAPKSKILKGGATVLPYLKGARLTPMWVGGHDGIKPAYTARL